MPLFPAVQAGPLTSVPVLPLPEESEAVGLPEDSSSFQYAISPEGGVFTTRLKFVVFTTAPPVPVTVMGYVPTGVDEDVVIVSVEIQVGLQLAEE